MIGTKKRRSNDESCKGYARSERHTKAMDRKLAADGTLMRSLYDSEIQASRWKADRGRTCASFRTTDGGGSTITVMALDHCSKQNQGTR